MHKLETAIVIFSTVFASTGFWSFINLVIQKRSTRLTAEQEMIRGLAHDRICYLGEQYIKRGWISKEEYENLHDYLFVPYEKLNGNGTAAKVMKEVDKLPIK